MATTHKQKKAKPRSKFRASWRGQLRFGLVSFEVQAINAEIKENAEVRFHLLHAPDRQRIHYAKTCPKHGEVPNDEIVEGYEYAKGKYVEFVGEKVSGTNLLAQRARGAILHAWEDRIEPLKGDSFTTC